MSKKAWAERIARWGKNSSHHRSEIEKANEEIPLLSRRIGKTMDDEVAAILESELKAIKAQRDQMEIQADNFQKNPPNYEEAFARVGTIIKDPYSYWKSGSIEQKKTVHRMVFTVSPSYDRNTGFGTIDLTLPYLITSTYKDDCSRLVEVARKSWHRFIEAILRSNELLMSAS